MEWLINIALSIPFVASFFAVAWVSRKIVGHWLNPGSIYSLFWLAMTIIPLAVSFGSPINPLAVVYILFTSVAFTCSMIPLDWKIALERNSNKHLAAVVFGTGTLYYFTLFFSLVGMFAAVWRVLSIGFAPSELLFNTLDAGSAFASARYQGELESTFFGKLGLLSSYLAVFTGSLFASSTKNRAKRYLVIMVASMPAILTTTLQSSKGLLFLSLAFFYAGVLVARIYNQNLVLVARKDIRNFVFILIFIFPIIIASFLARGLSGSSDINFVVERLRGYLVSYSSGHLYAFSDWFGHYLGAPSLNKYHDVDTTPGFFSMLSLFRSLGETTPLPQGIYSEYFKSGEYLQSNIYTAFRGLITDFGVIGSLLVVFTLGLVANVVFIHLLKSKKPAIAISLFFLMIGAIYMSYIVSILTWTVIPISIAFLTLILYLNFRKFKIY